MSTEVTDAQIGQMLLEYGLVILAIYLAVKFMPRLLTNADFIAGKELQKRLEAEEEIVLIDVRSEEEYNDETGHVPGAINIPLGQLLDELKAKKKQIEDYEDQPVFIIGQTERRAPHASRMLSQVGFKNINVLRGGMNAWVKAGLPLEGPSKRKAKNLKGWTQPRR